jgi:acetyltransferase-like isoleucine patch superfamily enzyme
MEISNINLGVGVNVDPTTSINNVILGDMVKISKYCSVFGSKNAPIRIGRMSYVGMQTIINGYSSQVTIGAKVSIAQNVNIMSDSGPNASKALQELFPIIKGEVNIGDECWIGTGSIIMPGVQLGTFCVVAANSFVNTSFEAFSIVGGNPARLLRKMTSEEVLRILKFQGEESLNAE